MEDRRSGPSSWWGRHAVTLSPVVLIMLSLVAGPSASAGTVERLSVAPQGGDVVGLSILPASSADGRHIAFISQGPGVTADDDDARWDVFVRDRELGTTVLVSKSSAGVKGNFDSGDPQSYAMGGPS